MYIMYVHVYVEPRSHVPWSWVQRLDFEWEIAKVHPCAVHDTISIVDDLEMQFYPLENAPVTTRTRSSLGPFITSLPEIWSLNKNQKQPITDDYSAASINDSD